MPKADWQKAPLCILICRIPSETESTCLTARRGYQPSQLTAVTFCLALPLTITSVDPPTSIAASSIRSDAVVSLTCAQHGRLNSVRLPVSARLNSVRDETDENYSGHRITRQWVESDRLEVGRFCTGAAPPAPEMAAAYSSLDAREPPSLLSCCCCPLSSALCICLP